MANISLDLQELAQKVADLETENKVLKEINSSLNAKILELTKTAQDAGTKQPLLG